MGRRSTHSAAKRQKEVKRREKKKKKADRKARRKEESFDAEQGQVEDTREVQQETFDIGVE